MTNLSKIFANIVGNADHLLEYWIYIHNNKGIQSPPNTEHQNANKWKIFSSFPLPRISELELETIILHGMERKEGFQE